MTKLDFGGFYPDEPPYDRDADPVAQLREIAACALDGRAMRPNLARWFFEMHAAGRVTVKSAAGRKNAIPQTQRLLAQEELDRLVSEGLPVVTAAEKVIKELRLPITADTLEAWRRDSERQRLADLHDQWTQVQDEVKKQLRDFVKLGIKGEEALLAFESKHDGPYWPTRAVLVDWLSEAEYLEEYGRSQKAGEK